MEEVAPLVSEIEHRPTLSQQCSLRGFPTEGNHVSGTDLRGSVRRDLPVSMGLQGCEGQVTLEGVPVPHLDSISNFPGERMYLSSHWITQDAIWAH